MAGKYSGHFVSSLCHTHTHQMYLKDNGNLHLLVGGGETVFMYLKSPVMQFPSVRLSLIFLRAEYKICTYYIYPLFSIEQTWKIVKLRMRTEMEEPFYTTLFHFIIT